MESNDPGKVIAFDTLFSTNHIQMLKIMLPYMDNQLQKSIAVYIKFLELRYTIDFYQKNPYPLCGCMKKEPPPSFPTLRAELSPYCTPNEKKQLEQMQQLFQNMEKAKELSKTMEMIKELMPEGASFEDFPFFTKTGSQEPFSQTADTKNASSEAFDMMDILMNMLTPEQKQIFEMFGGNQNDN